MTAMMYEIWMIVAVLIRGRVSYTRSQIGSSATCSEAALLHVVAERLLYCSQDYCGDVISWTNTGIYRRARLEQGQESMSCLDLVSPLS